jgi:hypothetical protein
VWGLTHSILVIVPLKFTGLLASNSAANAWCADAEEDHPVVARPMIPITMASFVFIVASMPRIEPRQAPFPRRLDYPCSG